MSRTRFRLLALVVTVALFAVACGGDDDDPAATDGGDGAADDDGTQGESASDGGDGTGDASTYDSTAGGDGAGEAAGGDAAAGSNADFNGGKPTVEVPAGPPPDELVTIDLIEGHGEEIVEGSTVEVHYVGVAWSTGEEFDASWDNGRTFDVQLGQGRVIAGWDQGLVGMREGGRRELRIPPDLAYGAEGNPPVIGPDETLIFVVDVVESAPPPDPSTEPTVVFPDEVPDDLVVEELVVGEGDVAETGSRVVINFVLGVVATEEVVASTWEVGQPFVFDLGGGPVQTVEGLDRGVEGMRVGGLRRIVVPPDLGFGEAIESREDSPISAEDTLVFVVELVEVR